MNYLSNSSKELLHEIINSNNPTDLLSERLKSATPQEESVLRASIKELGEQGHIKVSLWADNLPYHVIINNSAREYFDETSNYEDNIVQIVDNGITIGNGNIITNSNISVNDKKSKIENLEDKRFTDKHPILIEIAIGLMTGALLMLPFWQKIIEWIGELF